MSDNQTDNEKTVVMVATLTKMAEIKLNLREPNADKETPINVIVRYTNQRLVYSSGKRILPKYWDVAIQKARKTKDFPSAELLNSSLRLMTQAIHEEIETYLKDSDQRYPEPKLYNLDANGRITTVVQGDDILKFKYNTDGQLIEAGMGNDIETFTYLNGNLVASSYDAKIWMSLSYGNSEVKNSIVYTWVFGELLDYDEIGYRVAPFIGKLSKNLPSKIVYGSGADQTIADLTYTTDASGKLSSVRMTSSSGSSSSFTSEYKFTYECK